MKRPFIPMAFDPLRNAYVPALGDYSPFPTPQATSPAFGFRAEIEHELLGGAPTFGQVALAVLGAVFLFDLARKWAKKERRKVRKALGI